MLKTNEAIDLYLLLKDHFPAEQSEFDIIQLIRIIIDSMIKKGQHGNYAKAIALMHDIDIETMKVSDPKDLLNLFVEGLLENNVIELMGFFREKVKYGISS